MDYLMISVDDHIDLPNLPRDLWTERLPVDLRERGPRVVEGEPDDPRTNTGPAAPGFGYYWVCDGKPWGGWAGGPSRAHLQKRSYVSAVEKTPDFEPGVLRPTVPDLRLADMTRDGIEASFMFGPVGSFRTDDPTLRTAIYQAYNDWLIEFCSAEPRRLHGIAALPGEDIAASTAEVYRLAKKGGVRQVNFLVRSAEPPIYDPVWEPFWSAVEETNMIVSFHVGGGAPRRDGQRPAQHQQERPAGTIFTSKVFIENFLDTFVGLMAEGVLDRHAGVRVMLAEVGLGWLPWVVHEMDYRYSRLVDNRDYWASRGGIGLTMKPSEVFKRNFWITFQDDPVGLALLDFCNEDHILWASDYPHPDSTYPNSRRIVVEQTSGITEAQRRKILRENALALYGLPDRQLVTA